MGLTTVGGLTRLYDVTLTVDAGNAYASADVITDTQILSGLFRDVDQTGMLMSIVVIDEDDQKAAFDVYFMNGSGAMGTVNGGASISDANARKFLGWQAIATGDYKDLGGVSVAVIKNIWLPVKAAAGTLDLYVAVINGAGTPTYTASGLKLRIGVVLD